MNVNGILQQALHSGNFDLDETHTRQILAAYGLPLVEQHLVSDPDSAAAAAQAVGFPVVLKGVGPQLQHKTEYGLVRLNIGSADEVHRAARDLLARNEIGVEHLLVQPQVAGKREFVAGLTRDSQFGPMVMFGVGGILTEVIDDTTFAPAPLPPGYARQMIEQIRGQKLLGAFRGARPVKLKQLIQVLDALSRLAVEHPEVREVDLNPLIADDHGDLLAVDALVTLQPLAQGPSPLASPKRIPPQRIGELFYPRSIAFVGASATLGKWGYMLVTNTLHGGFEGKIAPVNPKGGTLMGHAVYPSLADIPYEVDLAVVTLPARQVIDIIEQLRQKQIRNMVLISSGFGETDEAGKTLERDLLAAARQAGILLLGPNTMGIVNPHIRLNCIGSPVFPRAGSTAVVAQSGNMGTQLLAFAEAQGIGIRAFIGSGNEAMITIEDYLEAFGVDEKTRTVMMYLESVKNGPRFLEAAARVSRSKPIVMLKGGRSEAGNRAAASHTGALASDQRIFAAACRQAGIVAVDFSMDLLDLAAAFSALPLPRGNRVAIMTLGGGWGVVAADLCALHGLELPPLPPELVERMDRILPPYWSRANPVDIVGEQEWSIPMDIMNILLEWDGCDAVINLGIMGRKVFGQRLAQGARKFDDRLTPEQIDAGVKLLDECEARFVRHIVDLMEQHQKPVFGVTLLAEGQDQTVFRVAERSFAGIFYPTPERAAKAMAKMVEYARFRARCRQAPSDTIA